jgi:hypothetical protein
MLVRDMGRIINNRLRRAKEFFDEVYDQEATKAALLGSSAYTAFIVIIAILHHYLGVL